MGSAKSIAVTVAWVTPSVQDLAPLTLAAGATVADAIARSALVETYGIDLRAMRLGIRGRVVAASTALADGDRVEICRPLSADPKEARRLRAAARSRKGGMPAA